MQHALFPSFNTHSILIFMRVLMIDDDTKLSQLTQRYVSPFGISLETADRPSRGLPRLQTEKFDALILDLMLPEMDGFQVLRKLRESMILPLIMLTARGDVADRIVGLELGADDYLPKPFEPREPVARLQALHRRTRVNLNIDSKPQNTSKLISGLLELDRQVKEATLHGKSLMLTTSEFAALELLMLRAGESLDRDQIMEALRGIAFNGMAEALQRQLMSKVQLLMDVSHELRSPMGRIKMAAKMLPLETELKAQIRADVREMEELVSELLELYRIRDSAQKVDSLAPKTVAEIDLTSLLVDVVGPYASQKPGISMVTPSEPVVVRGDPKQLRRAFRNIVENAVKLSRDQNKPVEVSLKRETEETESNADRPYVIEIRDHGIGIAEDQRAHIFEPFYRADSSRVRETGGFGLGLPLAQAIIEAHGGSIQCLSQPDQGCVFKISLGLLSGGHPPAQDSTLDLRRTDPEARQDESRLKAFFRISMPAHSIAKRYESDKMSNENTHFFPHVVDVLQHYFFGSCGERRNSSQRNCPKWQNSDLWSIDFGNDRRRK